MPWSHSHPLCLLKIQLFLLRIRCMSAWLLLPKSPLKPRVRYREKFCSSLHQWRLFLSIWYTLRSLFADKRSDGSMVHSAASSGIPEDCKRATGGLRPCMMMGMGQSRTWTTTTTHLGSWWSMTVGRPDGSAPSMLARRSRMLHSCCICRVNMNTTAYVRAFAPSQWFGDAQMARLTQLLIWG
jgi:hypothetical protein